MKFSNIKEAEVQLIKSFEERGIKIDKKESVIVNRSKYGTPIYNTRIYTTESVYHLKFQRAEHMPLEDNQIRTAHAENDRLKHAIRTFGRGNKTDIGIDEPILFELLEMEENHGLTSYIINAVEASQFHDNKSVIYWCRVREFYELAMAWGSVIYNSSSYGRSVFLVPCGWMKLWNEPISAPAKLVTT